METGIKCPLHFEEKNGVLSAELSAETRKLLQETAGCMPWSFKGKRGLLYCSMEIFEKANRELEDGLKKSPLMAQIVRQVSHLYEIDAEGWFCLPSQAAQFAHIHGDAVLCKVSDGLLLLLAVEKTEEKPKEGEGIQVKA